MRPRLLPALLGVVGAAMLAYTLLPCGGRCSRGAPADIDAIATAAPATPAPRVDPADLVGLYTGPSGCTLTIDTVGRATGCGLDRQVSRDFRLRPPDGLTLGAADATLTFELNRPEEAE